MWSTWNWLITNSQTHRLTFSRLQILHQVELFHHCENSPAPATLPHPQEQLQVETRQCRLLQAKKVTAEILALVWSAGSECYSCTFLLFYSCCLFVCSVAFIFNTCSSYSCNTHLPTGGGSRFPVWRRCTDEHLQELNICRSTCSALGASRQWHCVSSLFSSLLLFL